MTAQPILYTDRPHLHVHYVYSLPRFKDVWSYAQALDNASCWNELAEATIYHLNIELGTIIITHTVVS